MSASEHSIEIVDLSSERLGAYDEAVGRFPQATLYHTRAWAAFLNRAFGATPRTFIALAGNVIVGTLPCAVVRTWRNGARLVSLPYSHLVIPLGDAFVADLLVQHALRYARDAKLEAEFRGAIAAESGTLMNTRVTLTPDLAAMRNRIDRKTRNQLHQAEQNGRLTLREAAGHDDFVAADRIMAVNRRHLGSATYRRGFFQLLHDTIGASLRLEMACLNDRPIAFMVTSCVNQNAIYHYGASLPEFRDARPNNLLMWSALCWAARRGATHIDLGTSLPTQSGLIRFKEAWGGTSVPISHVVIDRDGRRSVRRSAQDTWAARSAGAVVRRLPLPWFRTLTPMLVKEFG